MFIRMFKAAKHSVISEHRKWPFKLHLKCRFYKTRCFSQSFAGVGLHFSNKPPNLEAWKISAWGKLKSNLLPCRDICNLLILVQPADKNMYQYYNKFTGCWGSVIDFYLVNTPWCLKKCTIRVITIFNKDKKRTLIILQFSYKADRYLIILILLKLLLRNRACTMFVCWYNIVHVTWHIGCMHIGCSNY